MIRAIERSYFGRSDLWKSVSFERAIKTKTRFDAIAEVVRTFPPETLNVADLNVLFDQLQKDGGVGFGPPIDSYVINARLSPSDVVDLLRSSNRLKVRFGLLRARFYRDKAYISAILENIYRYPDYEKNWALRTLSLLTGEYRGIDFYADWRAHILRSALGFASPDCRLLKKRDLFSLGRLDEGDLNICLYESVGPVSELRVSAVEKLGWVRIPLSPGQAGEITRLFHSGG